MPVGNGRMGTLVWTTPSEVRLQINRVDVYANNSYSNSFIERHNDYCSGCAYVDIDFGASQKEVFVAPAFKQRLSVYEGVMSLAGNRKSLEMIAWSEGDVIAAQVHSSDAGTVEIRLRMLRKASQYFGGELETFAREHIAAVQTRNYLAKCQLRVEGERIVLTQEFTEGDYYNKSAVAIALEGQTAKAEIVNETDVRLTAHLRGRLGTILISSASTFDRGVDVVRQALDQIDAAAAKGYAGLQSETSEWWHKFWRLGSVELESPDGAARLIEANYHYFLYVMGASSQGKYPPKFNGMLWNTGGDLRTWGAQHWFANTSCYYEALFTANRLDLLNPFFDMYSGMLEACSVAARQQ